MKSTNSITKNLIERATDVASDVIIIIIDTGN